MDGLGFEEWKLTAFENTPIPEHVMDKAYHISSPSAQSVSQNQNDLALDFEQHIAIYRRGFSDTSEAVDNVICDIQSVLDDLLAPAQRLGNGHLNIKFEDFTIEPVNTENDNSVKATLKLSVRLAIGL